MPVKEFDLAVLIESMLYEEEVRKMPIEFELTLLPKSVMDLDEEREMPLPKFCMVQPLIVTSRLPSRRTPDVPVV